ncbi:hypothetical protein PICMEDRAFT_74493 [Pichia membranifaciens NRRL Y-2026]|uniref:Uncharacterized protein n=1 Tax=Pichia membranifaciens NRRL Y-2026 TaxID=763406 RepID=A0A1E3NGV4_9ASCO|nr:hypothetical protein PICMEDRAFT_74493 [Pichia membranifaciens NRRL Y-2026]ODQ44798.1 hypothetical protein PICMEDRAFT_74493 [Pichia membranifaciens NRRL Y-2026]
MATASSPLAATAPPETSTGSNVLKTGFLRSENKIIEEIVNVLTKPTKYGISDKDMFTVFNSSSSMLDNIVNGPKMTTTPFSVGTGGQTISTKMVDFQNLVALGQQLADKRKVINIESPEAVRDSLDTVKSVYRTLSSHVYINHVKTPAATAAVTAAAASSNEGQSSWWNMIYPSKVQSKTLDPKTPLGADSVADREHHSIPSSTNPLESHDYFPDLRLVLKNVLILFISFFKRYDELAIKVVPLGSLEQELMRNLKDLMLLLNVSILNKLIEIFKMLNPNIKLKAEQDIFIVLAP